MLKKITINLISLILKSLLSLLLFKIITDSVSPVEYAPYGASLIIIGLMTNIGSIGLGPALVRTEYNVSDKVNFYLFLSVIMGFLLSVGLYISSPYVETLLKINGSAEYIKIISPIVVVKLISMIYESLAQRELKIKEITIIDFMTFLVMHFSFQIVILKLELDIIWLVIGILFEEIIRLILYRHISNVKFSFGFNIVNIKEDLKFSSIITINRIINYFNAQIDKIYVSNQLSNVDFSGYSRVFQLINFPINIIGQLFDKIIYPLICKNVRASNGTVNLNELFVAFAVGILGTTICYFIGEYVELYFFSGEWRIYMELYYVLILLIPIRLVDRYSSVLLNALGKPIIRTMSQILFIVTLVLFLAIFGNGLKSIAIISVFSYSVSALTSILYLVFNNEK
ncbi:oligosaccharide flippase family protein [Vibrio cholerae]|uniref:oligosaccharide flippase family protein n=1 Tax=Vibrio cholerae TaxID=666 RepID=UPI003099B7C6